MLEPVKSRKIYENIVDQIKKMIIQGSLKIGDRLPSERELAESLKVSRTSVREALRTLENMGLVECRSGDGNFVKDLTVDSLANSIALRIPLQKGTILQLFELRKIIEPGIVRIAAERVTDEDILRMESIIDKQKSIVEQGKSIADIDDEFHRSIAVASKNKMIMRIINTVIGLETETNESNIEIKERPRQSLKSHMNILKYLKAREQEKARRAMLTHLLTVERLIRKNLEKV
ncbi:MAG TPA: FadR/GntR family transcriptional regulator [Nitrospinota bacterium]|nr:FadR/GntR family transcriptional regulator [Nitrospinota bacterium]